MRKRLAASGQFNDKYTGMHEVPLTTGAQPGMLGRRAANGASKAGPNPARCCRGSGTGTGWPAHELGQPVPALLGHSAAVGCWVIPAGQSRAVELDETNTVATELAGGFLAAAAGGQLRGARGRRVLIERVPAAVSGGGAYVAWWVERTARRPPAGSGEPRQAGARKGATQTGAGVALSTACVLVPGEKVRPPPRSACGRSLYATCRAS